MTLRTKFWIGVSAVSAPIFIGLATPRTAPAWIRHVEDGVVLVDCIPVGLFVLVVLVALVTPARVVNRVADRLVERASRHSEPAVREVPASNGIQVLGTFLRDDLHTFFERKYDIVRRIHGDDNASRLTREQIEAEYDRYDRAETAKSEDRCQTCDPDHAPADLLVEGWDERPGRKRYIGEWLLCTPHANEKVDKIRSTGAHAVSVPLVSGEVR